jgi:2,4-dienoyl-CoA reductase-like NADH-dependent reductase (Old Yellow Enzyme family)
MTAPLLFTPLKIREVMLKNRIVIAPMHQYSGVKGYPTDWHLMSVGRYAAGGAGLVFVESTKVERRGSGTIGDLGLWKDDFIPHFKRLADFIRSHDAVPAIQLGHSGRKARRYRPWEGGGALNRSHEIDDWDDWELVSSTSESDPGDPSPRTLSIDEVKEVVVCWGDAASRANQAGFDVLEIHGAHGYLIHQFLSPQVNRRNDIYGGSEENRMRFAVEITKEVRSRWPENKPLFMRLSVEDDAGWGPNENVRLARVLKEKGVDVIDCSSGGIRGAPVVSAGPVGYGYQVPYAEKLKKEAEIQTMAVGLIVHADQAEDILISGRADLIAIAREAMQNPNWPLDAAQKLNAQEPFSLMPSPYKYWLEKRAKQVEGLIPSTHTKGIKV